MSKSYYIRYVHSTYILLKTDLYKNINICTQLVIVQQNAKMLTSLLLYNAYNLQ